MNNDIIDPDIIDPVDDDGDYQEKKNIGNEHRDEDYW